MNVAKVVGCIDAVEDFASSIAKAGIIGLVSEVDEKFKKFVKECNVSKPDEELIKRNLEDLYVNQDVELAKSIEITVFETALKSIKEMLQK